MPSLGKGGFLGKRGTAGEETVFPSKPAAVSGGTEQTVSDYERLTKLFDLVSKSLDYQLQQTKQLSLFGYNEVEIAQERVRLAAEEAERTGDKETLTKEILNLQKEINEQIREYGNEVKSFVQSTLSDLLQMKDVDLFENVTKKFQSMWAESMATSFTDMLASSGIFEKFGVAFSDLSRILFNKNSRNSKIIF